MHRDDRIRFKRASRGRDWFIHPYANKNEI